MLMRVAVRTEAAVRVRVTHDVVAHAVNPSASEDESLYVLSQLELHSETSSNNRDQQLTHQSLRH